MLLGRSTICSRFQPSQVSRAPVRRCSKRAAAGIHIRFTIVILHGKVMRACHLLSHCTSPTCRFRKRRPPFLMQASAHYASPLLSHCTVCPPPLQRAAFRNSTPARRTLCTIKPPLQTLILSLVLRLLWTRATPVYLLPIFFHLIPN